MKREPPSVPDLQAAPELAALDLLVTAVEAASTALVAEHPELCDLEPAARDGPLPTTVFLADAVLRLGDGLAAAIAAYRETTLRRPGVRHTFDTDNVAF
jgi:hypothetical protein